MKADSVIEDEMKFNVKEYLKLCEGLVSEITVIGLWGETGNKMVVSKLSPVIFHQFVGTRYRDTSILINSLQEQLIAQNMLQNNDHVD